MQKYLSILFATLFIFAASGPANAQQLQIHTIDVGQGASELIIGPNGTSILIDGGKTDEGISQVIPYLNAIFPFGSRHLDYIIASHDDGDHYGGLISVLNYGYTAGTIYHCGDNASFGRGVQIPLGLVIDLGNGARATCVGRYGEFIDGSYGYMGDNNESICLLIEYGVFDYVTAGDLESNEENLSVALITYPPGSPLLDPAYGADVIHVNHHGSDSSSKYYYINRLKPELAVINGGTSYDHPRWTAVDRIKGRANYTISCACVPDTCGDPTGVNWSGGAVFRTTYGDQGDCKRASLSDCPVLGDMVITYNGYSPNYYLNGVAYPIDEPLPITPTPTSSPTPSPSPTRIPGDVMINEILAKVPLGIEGDANGDGVRSGWEDEFVELVNWTGHTVDLGGCTFSDDTAVRYTFDSPFEVPPGKAVVIFGGGTPTGEFGGSAWVTVSDVGYGLYLNDTGDTVTLRNGDEIYDIVTYGQQNYTSYNRWPEIRGSFEFHNLIPEAGGRLFSPGTKVNGDVFEYEPSPTPTPSLTPTPSPTATQTPSPSPTRPLTPIPTNTPLPTPIPTSTPDYCNQPLTISHIENAWLAQTRSAESSGFAWAFYQVGYNDSNHRYGWLLDSGNTWSDQHSLPNTPPVKLSIYNNSTTVNVLEGDYVSLQYDGGKTIKIYPPPLSDENSIFYINNEGSTYYDIELCNLAKSVPSPTPTATPTPSPTTPPTPSVTPTPTPSVTPTPSITPTVTPTPTPTITPPYMCNTAFTLQTLEIADINNPRSSRSSGWVYTFEAFEEGSNWGDIKDNENSYNSSANFTSPQRIQISVVRSLEDFNVQTGDYISLVYDGGQTLNIYFPQITGTGTRLFYPDADGNTYHGKWLCDLAKSVPSPTIITTPSPSVSPSITPTPSIAPTPSISPSIISTPTIKPTPNISPIPSPVSQAPSWIYDYNGDGTSDIAIFREGSGLWAVRGITRVYFGSSTDETVPGDYNGDGTTEIGIFRGTSGLWAIRGATRAYFGSGSDLPEPGDYDGDGTADIGIYRSASGLWAIQGVTRIYFGGAADLPASGYYDGDSAKDIGIFRGSSGLWAIRNVTRVYFGSSSDRIVPGDYNGDGVWETGIFRGSSGLWAIRGVTRSYFGSGVDQPVLGDYRGDGKDDIGIYRGSSGLWAISGVSRVYFGGSGDVPVER
jgi:beta-lactamase superfamily II metal-dependent hydrolase